MLFFDSLIRFSSCGVALVLVLLLLRDSRSSTQTRSAVALCIAVAASMVWQSQSILSIPFVLGLLTLLIVINLNIIFWFFCRSLFEDGLKFGGWDGAATFLWFISGIPLIFSYLIDHHSFFTEEQRNHALMGYADVFRNIGGSSIVLHVSWVIWRGRTQDLVEPRRKIRGGFVLLANLWLLFIIISESSLVDPFFNEILNFVEALGILVLMLWAVWWLASVSEDALLFVAKPTMPKNIDLLRENYHQQILALMEGDNLFQKQGLTIVDLAERLGLPQHQLRVLINQTMGYRNFNAFLNHYRINSAKRLLADPARVQSSILSIAMEVGYASLAPFNRAFQAQEQCTPREFRKSH